MIGTYKQFLDVMTSQAKNDKKKKKKKKPCQEKDGGIASGLRLISHFENFGGSLTQMLSFYAKGTLYGLEQQYVYLP